MKFYIVLFPLLLMGCSTSDAYYKAQATASLQPTFECDYCSGLRVYGNITRPQVKAATNGWDFGKTAVTVIGGGLINALPYVKDIIQIRDITKGFTKIAGSKQGDITNTSITQTHDEQFNQEISTNISTSTENSLQANSGGQISGGDSSQFESTDIRDSQNPSSVITKDSYNPSSVNNNTSYPGSF